MSVRITSITKDSEVHTNPHEGISSVSWIHEKTKKTGKTSRTSMYEWIERGGQAYVIGPNEEISYIGTAVSSRGVKYIRAYANGEWNDNLLHINTDE
jgi:Protein of unknown function (DUF3892)